MDITENADKLEREALHFLETMDENDRIEWLQNPCTGALLKYLECDMLRFVDQWVNGSFTGENVDATAQLNAKALGSMQTLDNILDWVQENLRKRKETIDGTESSGTQAYS